MAVSGSMSVAPALLKMSPSQNHIRLGAHAPQVGKHRQNRVQQFSGHRSVVVGQVAAQHVGQSTHRLTLAIAAAFDIEPTPVVTEKIVKPMADAASVLQEAQVRCHAAQHAVVWVLGPQTNAKSQRPGVVVGRVAAFTAGEAIDGVLDQPGGVGHAIEMFERDRSRERALHGLRAGVQVGRCSPRSGEEALRPGRCRLILFSAATPVNNSKYC